MHGEHRASYMDKVEHDVFGTAAFMEKGKGKCMDSLRLELDTEHGEPNPRWVTSGHVYNKDVSWRNKGPEQMKDGKDDGGIRLYNRTPSS